MRTLRLRQSPLFRRNKDSAWQVENTGRRHAKPRSSCLRRWPGRGSPILEIAPGRQRARRPVFALRGFFDCTARARAAQHSHAFGAFSIAHFLGTVQSIRGCAIDRFWGDLEDQLAVAPPTAPRGGPRGVQLAAGRSAQARSSCADVRLKPVTTARAPSQFPAFHSVQ